MAQLTAERTETVAAPYANPGPLGLSAFAVTTFVLSVANAGIISSSDTNFLGLAFAFGGLAQLLAGMWEFRAGNTLGATAFSSYGAFWLSFAYGVVTKTLGGAGVSYYLLAWGILTFVFLLASLRSNLALISVFLFLTLTFLALAIGAFVSSDTWHMIGGWLGIITAILAEYAALAGLLSAERGAFTLPIFPVRER
jgi:succinate-acetate transporter protein